MHVTASRRTGDAELMVGTSAANGSMYLIIGTGAGRSELKLTEENRDALRHVLGPTSTWAGILALATDRRGMRVLGERRDISTDPYTPDEQRVVGYLAKLIPEVGAGDDPIGFLMASHATIVAERKERTAAGLPYGG